jgi:hypothetical protein
VTTLTEEVVFAFAKAWNRLVPNGFLDLLAPDARYASQWVFDELVPPPPVAHMPDLANLLAATTLKWWPSWSSCQNTTIEINLGGINEY